MNRKRLRVWMTVLAGSLLFLLSLKVTGCDFAYFRSRAGHLTDLTSKMFPPDLPYLFKIWMPIAATLQMSVVGTVTGAVLGLVSAPFCAANLGGNRILRWGIRTLVQILRSFPALILALTATFLLGLGTFSGSCALAIYTFAIMTRLSYEDVEAVPLGAFHALKNMGTGTIPSFCRTILPEILPSFLTNTLYLMETNVRHSAIMGYVGAGGIGLLLNEKISWREYSRVGTILLALFVVVCAMEGISEYLVSLVRGKRNLRSSGKKGILLVLSVLIVLCFATSEGPDLSHTSPAIVKNMISGLFHPNLEFLLQPGPAGLRYLLAETVCISFAGTVLGAIPAMILAFLNTERFVKKLPALLFRIVIMLIRSVPFVIYGLIFIRVTGTGAFAGVLTMAVCSIGLLSKRFTEAIEALDLRGYYALKNMGTGTMTAICRGVLPQLWPVLASGILYRFDVNIREASILGFVGAGGIGATLILAMNKYAWTTAGAVFLGMVVLVWIIDQISGKLRKQLK